MNLLVVFFAIVSAISIGIHAGIVTNLVRGRKAFRKSFTIALITSILTILFYMCYLVSYHEVEAKVTSALYYASVIWLDYIVYIIIAKYTGFSKITRVPAIILGVLSIIMVASHIVDIFTNHLYAMDTVVIDGYSFWTIVRTPWNLSHNLVVIALMTFILGMLIWKLLDAPRFYRERYAGLIISLVLILVGNRICELLGIPIDLSVLMFGFFALFANYYINYGMPSKLMSKTLQLAMYHVNAGYIYYDNQGTFLYANREANELFWEDRTDLIGAMERYLSHRVDVSKRYPEGDSWEESFVEEAEQRICDVTFHEVLHENVLIGYYLELWDKTEERKRFKEERYRATHDLLTGIYNRERLLAEVDRRVVRGLSGDWVFVTTNIKDFKLINEIYGEEAGDHLLMMEAKIIRESVHESSLYGRIGADIFAVFMERKYFVPELFLDSLMSLQDYIDKENYHFHCHVGVYEMTNPTEMASLMYDKTAMAIHSIENDYQKVFAYYDSSLMDRLMYEIGIVDDFDEAIRKQEFLLYLQPQVRVDREVSGFAALAYMYSQDDRTKCIPVLEKIYHSAKSHRLDQFIWEEGVSAVAAYNRAHHTGYYVCVKINAKDLYYIDVPKKMQEIADRFQMPYASIHVEIPENVLMLDSKKNIEMIAKMQEMGFYLVISEFGDGYSSLNMLKYMEIDAVMLNVDVFESDENQTCGHIIFNSVVEMSEALDTQVIVHDVTKASELDFIESTNHIYQGDYFASPFPAGELDGYMTKDLAR